MNLYERLDRVFPRSYTAKLFCVAFVGTHVPLVTMVVLTLARHRNLMDELGTLLPLLVATLLGTAATLLALKGMLSPLFLVQRTLERYCEGETARMLPDHHQDQVGVLMKGVNTLLRKVSSDLDQAVVAAQTDPLTGLLNRRGFQARTENLPRGALLLIDIDRFKSINDTLGHDMGDEVLSDVAQVLKDSVRTSDIVGRHGGEEFIIYLPKAELHAASDIAERIRRSVAEQVHAGPRVVTVSIGVALSTRSTSLPDLIQRADEAIYKAKRGGRNKVVISEFALV